MHFPRFCLLVLAAGATAGCASMPRSAPPGPAAVAREAIEQLFNRGDLGAADRLFSPELAAEERDFTMVIRRAFPGIHLTADRVIEQRDWVAIHWTATGVHAGDFGDLKATGRMVTWSGAWFWRVENGRVVDGKQFNVWDRFGLRAQLTASTGEAP